MIKQTLYILNEIGLTPLKVQNLRHVPRFIKEIRSYNQLNKQESFKITLKDLWPIWCDYNDSAGTIHTHYFQQDLWAARKIYNAKPSSHIDIGSRIDGFVGHILAFMDVTVVDVRPLEDNQVEGLSFICDDATELSQFESNSIESISTLHAVEHFGLGRYGDPIDPESCFKFMSSLERVLAPNGKLYFSTPVGKERLQFNAHRIFSPQTILKSFTSLELVSFSCVDDKGHLHENVDVSFAESFNYGCGMFEFTKKGS